MLSVGDAPVIFSKRGSALMTRKLKDEDKREVKQCDVKL